MPYSLNGTGTTYYGKAMKWDDGSYIVTEWLTVFWLPVLPLGSKRVWYQDYENRGRGTSTRFKVAPVPVYWPQVAWGYAVTGGLFAVGWLLSSENQRWIEDNVGWLLPIAGLVLLIAATLTLFLRKSAHAAELQRGTRDWVARNRSALGLSSAIGAATGIAVAFVLTGDGASFASWLLEQEYYNWSVVGWGIVGAVLGPSLLLVTKLSS